MNFKKFVYDLRKEGLTIGLHQTFTGDYVIGDFVSGDRKIMLMITTLDSEYVSQLEDFTKEFQLLLRIKKDIESDRMGWRLCFVGFDEVLK